MPKLPVRLKRRRDTELHAIPETKTAGSTTGSIRMLLSTGTERVTAVGQRVTTATTLGLELAQPVLTPLRKATNTVTSLGITVLAVSAATWLLAWRFGWAELMLMSAAALALFLLCILLTIGRTTLQVEVELHPQRVTVGDSSAGQVHVTNVSRTRLLPIALELPVGTAVARFNLPSLGSGATHAEMFLVPTQKRGVIDVGPATTVRGDPLGLLRRAVPWTGVIEVFIHPRTTALETFSTGLLRDLEGQTTNDISMSDLAFHTLREYAPGDDRRYIHWKSSAKHGATAQDGKFLVRQFLDTRRSHLTAVVDTAATSYLDPDEDFEAAISAAASVVVRAFRDEMPSTLLIGKQTIHERPASAMLDAFSRAALSKDTLVMRAAQASRVASDTSVALLFTGANTDFVTLQRAASYFPHEVNVVAVQVNPEKRPAMTSAGPLTILTMPQLRDLPLLLGGMS